MTESERGIELSVNAHRAPEVSPSAKLWALVVSIIVVAAGVTWTWKVGQDSNFVDHQVGAATDGLAGLKKVLDREGVKY